MWRRECECVEGRKGMCDGCMCVCVHMWREGRACVMGACVCCVEGGRACVMGACVEGRKGGVCVHVWREGRAVCVCMCGGKEGHV